MNKSAEISKDGKTLTVNTFKDLKHFLDRVRYKHFQITVDKPIKELIIKDSKTDWTVNYEKELLHNAALQTVENFEIISPDSRFCTIDGLLYSGSGENLYLCPIGREGTLIIPDGTKMIFVERLPVIIMPKMLTEIPSAARAICRLAESNDNRTPPAMYSYNEDAIARSAAIEQRKMYPDTKIKAYITRNATLFLSDVLFNESDWNQVIIGFIKDGVFTIKSRKCSAIQLLR